MKPKMTTAPVRQGERQNKDKGKEKRQRGIDVFEFSRIRRKVDKVFAEACEKLERDGERFDFFNPEARRAFEQSRALLLSSFLKSTGKVLRV